MTGCFGRWERRCSTGKDDAERIIVRHLLLPGALKNAKAVVKYVYETYGDEVYLSLMNQYTPLEGANLPEPLNRKVTKREYERLVDYALELGVTNAFIRRGIRQRRVLFPRLRESDCNRNVMDNRTCEAKIMECIWFGCDFVEKRRERR